MALRPQESLGELRDELARRLGFGAQVGNLGAQEGVLKSFLKDAQNQLWWQFDLPQLIVRQDRMIGVDQEVLDYPDDCDPAGSILEIRVLVDTVWRRLDEGIDYIHDSYRDAGQWPTRYERLQQLYFWPLPKQQYLVRIEYKKYPARFTQDEDRCTIYDRLVFLYALVMAKWHYRQPDASQYENKLVALLAKLRSNPGNNERYIRGDTSPVGASERDVMMPPRVV